MLSLDFKEWIELVNVPDIRIDNSMQNKRATGCAQDLADGENLGKAYRHWSN
jgi:hypothetical protein